MNRAERRNLKRVVAKAIKGKTGLTHPIPDSVVLHGGPMTGWIVKPDAPALELDWRAKYLEEAARREFTLAEQQKQPVLRRRWEDIPGAEQDGWRDAARIQYGAGHYEQRVKGQAEWVVEV